MNGINSLDSKASRSEVTNVRKYWCLLVNLRVECSSPSWGAKFVPRELSGAAG